MGFLTIFLVKNINPSLQFSNITENTESLVLEVKYLDESKGRFTHQTVWNIDLGSNIGNSAPIIEGENSFADIFYGEPYPLSNTTQIYLDICTWYKIKSWRWGR